MTDGPEAERGLASQFPPADPARWQALVEKTLAGRPIEAALSRSIEGGITVRALATRATVRPTPAGPDGGFPGTAPFLRGGRAAGASRGGWDIRQAAAHPDPVVANAELLEELAGGATSLWLRLDDAARAGFAASDTVTGGMAWRALGDVAASLDGVHLDIAPVALDAGAATPVAAAGLLALVAERGRPLAPGGSLGFDPIAALAMTGGLPTNLPDAMAIAADFAVEVAARHPGLGSVAIDATPFVMAGGSEVEALACSLAGGVAALRALLAAGLDPDAAARQVSWILPVGADLFPALASLRAARLVWHRAATACGAAPASAALRITARTSPRMATRYDPWVNMLRATSAVFAAACGGAEAISVMPFDAALGAPSAFGRRIARNTQIVLMEEAGIGRVVDPAGGAYAVETLTRDMAEATWTRFQAIERAGGLAAVLGDGSLATRLAAAEAARAGAIARRKVEITGVSAFPDVGEILPTPLALDGTALIAAAAARTAAADRVAARPAFAGIRPGGGALARALIAAAAAGASFPSMLAGLQSAFGPARSISALPVRRDAAPFEVLRDRARAHGARTGHAPRLWLATLGPAAEHAARAGFAKSYLEAGGIATSAGDGTDDPAALAAAFRASGAPGAVVCGSPAQYEHLAVPCLTALAAAGASPLLIAGAPGPLLDACRAAGLDDVIALGDPVPETLAALLDRLQVGD